MFNIFTQSENHMLKSIAKNNPHISEHVPYLRVASRNYMKDRIVVKFFYEFPDRYGANTELVNIVNAEIDGGEPIWLDTVKRSMDFILSVTDNTITQLNIFTTPSDWANIVRENEWDQFNEFEFSVLKKIAAKYPDIKVHFPYLRILSREFTGVGMFLNLEYDHTGENIQFPYIEPQILSSDEHLWMDGIEAGVLFFVLTATGNKLEFIEFVSIGEWDGVIRPYYFK